ncbi:MAG: hypothetical protein IH620_03280 [Ignavibacterium sp.]|nr:hypothetical protein [Ignavibacterium sp.]
MDQLNLFDEINPKSFAVIFCSCIMKDQFGIIWERQEIVSTELSKDAAENLVKQKNEEIFPGKTEYYKVLEMKSVNILVG